MDIVWTPTDGYVERANVTRFMRAHGIGSAEELIERSTADVAWFWDAVVRDLGHRVREPYTTRPRHLAGHPVGDVVRRRAHQPRAQLRRPVGRPDAREGCRDRWEGEDGATRAVTYAELPRDADRAAHGLRELGVGAGDAVGIFMPMAPETVAATLACAKSARSSLPIFSGFGADAVAKRLAGRRGEGADHRRRLPRGAARS